MNIDKNMPKKVSFYLHTQTFIIPNRDYIISSGLKNELWWSPRDFDIFRNQSMQEVLQVKRNFPMVNFKTIQRIIYHPSYALGT